ncbi:MAG: hypothetical protein OEY25_11975, partial [Candidatus Aminicenantes bacterium]|nr:hypothetical protein [Candidatus Aminicenantes bacterium]
MIIVATKQILPIEILAAGMCGWGKRGMSCVPELGLALEGFQPFLHGPDVEVDGRVDVCGRDEALRGAVFGERGVDVLPGGEMRRWRGLFSWARFRL